MSAMDSEMENNQNHVESTDKSPPITLRLRSLSTLLEKPPDGMKPITDRRTSEREKETSYLKTVLKRKLDQTNTANSVCFVDVFESLMNKKVICLSSTCCQEENAKSANKFSSNASFFDTDIAILDYAAMEFENMDRGTKNHKNGPFRVDFKITNSPIVDDDFDLYDTKTDIPLNKLYVKGQTLEGSIPSIFGKFR